MDLDPTFALAWAELAEAHRELHRYYDRTDERLESMRVAVERALQLDPELPEAHRARAKYLGSAG